jgi:polysaccharide export outer membrane protein
MNFLDKARILSLTVAFASASSLVASVGKVMAQGAGTSAPTQAGAAPSGAASQSEAKPGARPETKPDAKSDTKPDTTAKPDTTTDAKPDAAPETRPSGATPEAKADAKPDAQTDAKAPANAPAAVKPDDRYRIGPGDVLEIRVYNRPQLSMEATRVDARGVIRIPMIDDELRAACQTEIELAQEIASRYRKYQRNPQVFVFVKEYNSQPVSVIGAVDKPGRFQLQRRVRLLELVSSVGGPTDKAGIRIQVAHTNSGPACDPSGALVSREQAGSAAGDAFADFEVYSLSETMQGDPKANPYIQPGDVITVPEAEQAFIVGNVVRPSPITLKNPTTVSQAIAMAGGVLPDSNVNRVRILRQEPGAQTKTELFVNLRSISQQQSDDPQLQAGDIIEIATLSGRKILRSILGGAGPSLATLPVYVLR